ncbi:MAG TPA: glycosyl hydrolase [Solirubrobacterales bacterium]|jgi:hypothetical protein
MGPRKRSKTRLGAALLLGLALLFLTIPGGAGAARQRPLYWGAWIGSQLTGTEAQWDISAVRRFQESIGKGLSLVEISSFFSDCRTSPCQPFRFPAQQMQRIRDYGAIPVLSWASASGGGPRQPDFQLSDLISGRYDRYIREFAEEARAWNHPFFLRFDWEMNGRWFPWGARVNGNQPGEYVAAWRHVHDLVASVGATNATWVWCPYAYEEEGVWAYYPGNRYVDWTCLDAYNWGPGAPEPAPWTSFRKLFGPAYEYIVQRVARNKPMLIAELASSGRGRPRQGGSATCSRRCGPSTAGSAA